MTRQRRGGRLRALLKGIFTSFCLTLCAFGLVFYGILRTVKEESPNEYRMMATYFGITSESAFSVTYELSEEEKQRVAKIGLDPKAVAFAYTASAWGKDKDMDVSPAIVLALHGGETGFGRNCGHFDACNEYKVHPKLNGPAQCQALKKLLEVWQRYDIRSSNPVAAEYIYQDYSGALGSKAGGALGRFQLLAGTAFPYMEVVGGSFDLWSEEEPVPEKVTVAHLSDLGWKEDLSPKEMRKVISRWNRNLPWGARIVKRALQYRKFLATETKLKKVFGFTPQGIKAQILLSIGLMPLSEREEALANLSLDAKGLIQINERWQMPVPSPIVWSSNTEDHIKPGRGSVPADDFSVPLGTPIFPTGQGIVTAAFCGELGGYGCRVQIDHGDGISSLYAHMIRGSIMVKEGDQVSKETVLGQVGWTGISSYGPHVHFEFRKNGVPVEPASIWGITPGQMGIPYKFWGKAIEKK